MLLYSVTCHHCREIHCLIIVLLLKFFSPWQIFRFYLWYSAVPSTHLSLGCYYLSQDSDVSSILENYYFSVFKCYYFPYSVPVSQMLKSFILYSLTFCGVSLVYFWYVKVCFFMSCWDLISALLETHFNKNQKVLKKNSENCTSILKKFYLILLCVYSVLFLISKIFWNVLFKEL